MALNVGFADGHAKFVRGSQLRAAYNPIDYHQGGVGPLALDMSWYYTNDLRSSNNPLRNSPSGAQDLMDGSEILH
jgi:prepilin-type processing-associated H-X9-DG protein